jgi:hypothetical protein
MCSMLENLLFIVLRFTTRRCSSVSVWVSVRFYSIFTVVARYFYLFKYLGIIIVCVMRAGANRHFQATVDETRSTLK